MLTGIRSAETKSHTKAIPRVEARKSMYQLNSPMNLSKRNSRVAATLIVSLSVEGINFVRMSASIGMFPCGCKTDHIPGLYK